MPHRSCRLKLTTESQASGDTARVFGEAKQALGMPVVPEVLQAYAAMPDFLRTMWAAAGPALRSSEFLRCAERLRAQAYTETFNYFTAIPQLREQAAEVNSAVELFHCAAPRMLLLTVAVRRALESPVGSPRPI